MGYGIVMLEESGLHRIWLVFERHHLFGSAYSASFGAPDSRFERYTFLVYPSSLSL